MASMQEDGVLEEGEIEDEEEETLMTTHNPYRVSKHSDEAGRSSSRHQQFSESIPSSRSMRAAAPPPPPPLTRGGFWAPPPLHPLPSTPTVSPGSRVFRTLRNRGTGNSTSKPQTQNSGEIENRRPVTMGNRSVKRKPKVRSSPHSSRPKTTENDNNYQDLLRKHKEIQSQLAKLKDEEKKTGSKDDDSVAVDMSEIPLPSTEAAHLQNGAPDAAVPDFNEAKTSGMATFDDSDVQIISVKMSPEILVDDDLDALELRRMALESVVAANAKKSAMISSNVTEKVSPTASHTSESSGNKRPKTKSDSKHTSPVKPTRRKTSHTSSASRRQRKPLTPRGPIDRYGRQKRSRNNSSSSFRELEIRRQEAEERRRQAEHRRSEETRKRLEERKKKEAQREAIQQILSMSNPAEQVEKFLKLIQRESPTKSTKKTGDKVNNDRRKSDGKSLVMEDNYEEVAMEIDSDTGDLSPASNLQLELFDTEPTYNPQTPSTMYNPAFLFDVPGFPPVSEWQYIESWPPPLPPEAPPPPPEDPPPSTPPAPPLPQSPCPESQTELEAQPSEGEDADEESLLREQLLKSMAIKKKAAVPTSGRSTPLSECPSPQQVPPTTKQKTAVKPVKTVNKSQKKMSYHSLHNMQFPVHKPVVISLGAHSDDSDSEEGGNSSQNTSLVGGIDAFLKQARQFVESQQTPIAAVEKRAMQRDMRTVVLHTASETSKLNDEELQERTEVKQMEEKLIHMRKLTLKDQPLLKELITESRDCQFNVKLAEERVTKIEQQLEAMKKLAMAYRKKNDLIKFKVREVRGRVREKLSHYRFLEANLLEKGKALFGDEYELPVQLGKKRTSERKVVKKSSGSIKRKMTSNEIAQEKSRLQILEQEYATKLKQLKLSKPKSVTEKTTVSVSKKTSIPRLDKIELGTNDKLQDEDEDSPVKRRRSLMDLDTSTKPNIASQENVHISRDEKGLESKNKEINFELPEGQQLGNLRKLQEEKVDKLLKSHSVVHSTDIPHLFYNPSKKLPDIDFQLRYSHQAKDPPTDIPICAHLYSPYHSPLLHFKAYRLCRYFRTKEGFQLSSKTYSNKVDPHKQLCPFELQGTCSDQSCTWQHEEDYSLSKEELLIDLVSYWPYLAGVKDDTGVEEYPKILANYAEKVLKQHPNFTANETSVLIVNEIHQSLGKKENSKKIMTERRKWRPRPKQNPTESPISTPTEDINIKQSPTKLDLSSLFPDPSSIDQRYFLDDQGLGEMEAAVMEHPDNVHLWIALAYRKLQETDSEEGSQLDLCLNVLARALEANKSSSELWYHYLRLYSHHRDAVDIEDLCQTALACAPSYPIWWQYLNVVNSFHAKESICQNLLKYLVTCTDLSFLEKSFCILESIIYLVDVYIQSGRYKTGLLYLKSLLPVDESCTCESELVSKMSPSDCSLLWLTLIHLSQFHHLPPSLRDPANQNPGKLVSTKPFEMPWRANPDTKSNSDIILKMLWGALDMCCLDKGEIIKADKDYRLAIYSNIITVQHIAVSEDEALKTCSRLMTSEPSLPELWHISSSILIHSQKDNLAVEQLNKGLTSHPYSAELYNMAANLHLTKDDPDQALHVLEQCVIALYHVDISDYKTCDPNLLYCKTLCQPVPLSYKAPSFVEGVDDALIQEQMGSLWLNYCMLLELQGYQQQAVESYETALVVLRSPEELEQLWIGYIQFHQRQLSNASPVLKKELMSLVRLLHRCLSAFPVKHKVPFKEDAYWLDYSPHNRILDVFLTGVPSANQQAVYHQLVQAMPSNINLVIRAVEKALSVGDLIEAQSLCNCVLYEVDYHANITLWKLVISLFLKTGNHRMVNKMYRRAVRKLPLTFTLWKDFLLFEVTQESEAGSLWVIDQCQKLGINIRGFVTTVSKLSR